MSDEPIYCTKCGAEDKECDHGWDDDGRGPYCEVDYRHEWTVNEDGKTARCIWCGLVGLLHEVKSE